MRSFKYVSILKFKGFNIETGGQFTCLHSFYHPTWGTKHSAVNTFHYSNTLVKETTLGCCKHVSNVLPVPLMNLTIQKEEKRNYATYSKF